MKNTPKITEAVSHDDSSVHHNAIWLYYACTTENSYCQNQDSSVLLQTKVKLPKYPTSQCLDTASMVFTTIIAIVTKEQKKQTKAIIYLR